MGISKTYNFITVSMFLAILGMTTLVGIVYYTHQNETPQNVFAMWAVSFHLPIMITLIIISVGFGFILSTLSKKEIKKSKKETKSLLKTLFLFLSSEEKEIIDFLIKNEGKTSQAEISRLPNLNRVKAYRSLQRMQEKDIIEIIPHGKIRKIYLKNNILTMLSKD